VSVPNWCRQAGSITAAVRTNRITSGMVGVSMGLAFSAWGGWEHLGGTPRSPAAGRPTAWRDHGRRAANGIHRRSIHALMGGVIEEVTTRPAKPVAWFRAIGNQFELRAGGGELDRHPDHAHLHGCGLRGTAFCAGRHHHVHEAVVGLLLDLFAIVRFVAGHDRPPGMPPEACHSWVPMCSGLRPSWTKGKKVT